MSIIEIKDLTKDYGNNQGIFDINLTIEKGEMVGFVGTNGSGKTTLINMISEKLNASRRSKVNKGSYFDLYVDHCNYEMSFEQPTEIKLITSDDVFDYLLDVRSINSNVNREKERLSKNNKEKES